MSNEKKTILPSSWSTLLYADAVDGISTNKKKINQKKYLESGIYPIFDQGNNYIGGYTNDSEKIIICEFPVVIFGDHTRAVKMVKEPFAAGADGVKVLQPKGFILPKLLQYFTNYLAISIKDKGYARHYQWVAKEKIGIPPENEQHRIVAKIEELFSELDKGIESLKRAREQLKVYRQVLLKHAFEGKLTKQWRKENAGKLETADQLLERIKKEREARSQQQLKAWQAAVMQWEAAGKKGKKPGKPKKFQDTAFDQDAVNELPTLPRNGTYSPLGDLIDDPKYGTSKKCTYETNRAGVLRIPNVVSGRVDSTDLKFAEFDDSELYDYALLDGDILLIRSNGSISIVGKAALIEPKDTDYIFAGYLIRLRPNASLIIPKYLIFVLEAHMMRKQIEAKAKSTSGVNNINSGEIKSLIVPVTGIEEQSEIVKLLEEKLSVVDSNMSDIEDNLIKSEALRQSILKKAFSGQLVPQDPNDEPASVLLVRIAAEKAEAATKAQKAKATRKKRITRRVG